MAQGIEENELVVLVDEKGNKIILRAASGAGKVKGLGVYDSGHLIGKAVGDTVTIAQRQFILLKPSIADMISSMERKAQIILPKDGMIIIHHCGIKTGGTVVEGGAGSGALTMLLAHAVAPRGSVISYEIREDFLRIAQRNVRRAGLEDYADLTKGDVTETINEHDVDAVVLDIPNPWDAVDNAFHALKVGGYLGSYSPTMNQVESTVKKMRDMDFSDIRTIETLQRDIVVGERGTRPGFDMLGHTGYVTIGRKISP
jgi:tRNA (adenine57-N1/adenine58-N1)-methyltransferase